LTWNLHAGYNGQTCCGNNGREMNKSMGIEFHAVVNLEILRDMLCLFAIEIIIFLSETDYILCNLQNKEFFNIILDSVVLCRQKQRRNGKVKVCDCGVLAT